MSKSLLSNDQWLALFAEELAGVPRRLLAPKYGVKTSTINQQARTRGLIKRLSGAPDHRKRPAGGWPEHEPLTRSPVGMSPARWREALERRLAGEETGAVAADYGVSPGRMVGVAAEMKMRKCDRPNAVYRAKIREGEAWGREDEGSGEPIRLRDAQQPPDGPWSTWLFLGGRGAGKTLAGASWLADQAEHLGRGGRLALIGPTLHDVREVMVEGVSGIRSLPRWTGATRPRFQSSRRRLVFANGCQAYAFSAEDPDSLRGPQFSAAWADEFCAWPSTGARGAAETLALLRMGLRRPGPDGRGPRLVVTTTPKPTRALVRLRDEASCILTHAPTAANAEHLSPGFLEGLEALYGGTKRAAQELEGKVVELDGALFTAEMMARARAWPAVASPSPAGEGRSPEATGWGRPGETDPGGSLAEPSPPGRCAARPPRDGEGDHPSSLHYDRTIVAIDPTATARGDACGLIAAARYRRADGTRCAVVLADRSIAGLGPDAWARRAVALAAEFGAAAIVAEVNQGGDMVRAVLKTAGAKLKIREVRASRGKYIRAEPVAALYEQGRIHHAGAFDALEEELMAFGGEMEAAGSLDRADALVWAVTDLLVDAPDGERGPRVRWV
jgi:phage terminase large subunit-like protein